MKMSPALQKIQDDADRNYDELVRKGHDMKAQSTSDWAAAGDHGYVNCLLTVMAEGDVDTITIMHRQLVPPLEAVAGSDPETQEWVAKILFDYTKISATNVIGILEQSCGIGLARPDGNLPTILVRRDGRPQVFVFSFQRLQQNAGLTITLWRLER